MGDSMGRPEVNNAELVNRALKLINRTLQDHIIAKMSDRYGSGWWEEKIFPRRRELGIPVYAPSRPDRDNLNVRSYMDVTLCLRIIDEYRLDPEGVRAPRSPLSYIRDLRNSLSHFGGDDYSDTQAHDAIRQMVCVADMLGADCVGKLEELYVFSLSPMSSPEADAEERPPRADQGPAPREGRPRRDVPARPDPSGGDAGDGPGDVPPETVPFVSTDRFSPLLAAGMACRGMWNDLSDEQRVKKEVARVTVDVKGFREEGDHYVLRLDGAMNVDDIFLIVDGEEYSAPRVSFDRYDGARKSIHMYPDDGLREVLEAGPKKVELCSDMKWLVSKTTEFFEDFLPYLTMPPAPMAPSRASHPLDARLSDEQRAAVDMAVSEPLSYVWGVPGSGKTQSVLAASIGECVRRGERVAVIAPTNVALEQVLRGLLGAFARDQAYRGLIDPARDVLRVGTPTAEFATEFPEVCEKHGLRRQLIARIEDRIFASRTMLERGYEGLRAVCEACAADAAGLQPGDAEGRGRLLDRMRPLLDLMSEDDRYIARASGVSAANIASEIPGIIDAVYGHDRSDYLEGDLASKDDDALAAWIRELDDQIETLRSKDPLERKDLKVTAMTLSKFIISYGPRGDDRRMGLDVDHVFVDEAGYCNCLQTLALFTLNSPVTMLGDHMQLPPVCEIKRDFMVETIRSGSENRYDFLWDLSALYVDHMFDADMSRLSEMYVNSDEPDFVRTAHRELTVTYRFGPNLAEALSRNVYPAGVRSASSRDLEVTVVNATPEPFPVVDGKPMRRNEVEVECVWDLSLAMGDDYVILTPYREQYKAILVKDGSLKDHLMTIHRSQGREWDTVIVSVVDGSANPEEKPPRFTSSQRVEGRLDGLRVINTALSRAKRRLFLVCDEAYWAAKPDELIGDIVRSCGGGRRGADQGPAPKS